MVHKMLSSLQSLKRDNLQELVVQKLINANQGLQVNQSFDFSRVLL